MIYRLLGHKRTALTGKEIEKIVREGLLSPDTKVTCEGEGFATAISSRAEIRHLLKPAPKHPRSGDRPSVDNGGANCPEVGHQEAPLEPNRVCSKCSSGIATR